MKIIEPGHIYELHHLDETKFPTQDHKEYNSGVIYDQRKRLIFVNREPGHEHPGTQTQEVLRALIDRTYHCDNCLPHELNAMIIHHLRMALVYHEMRALERKAEKGEYEPESVTVGRDGHFALTYTLPNPMDSAPRREFQLKPTQQTCKYRGY